ncbi:MAG: FmdB family zinc ribbon protein [Candidatus Omnitrophota bacterium]
MPTYEYECKTCGKVFEVFQQIKDKPLTKCAKEGCGGKVKRLIGGGAGFIFKGSGFYATDHRSEGYKKRQREDTRPSSPCSGCDKKEGGCKLEK